MAPTRHCNIGNIIYKSQMMPNGQSVMMQGQVSDMPTCNAANDLQWYEATDVLATPTYGAAPDAGGGAIH